MQKEYSKKPVETGWLRGGLGSLRALPLLAAMLTCVQLLPATNGTLLYSLIITDNNLKRADSEVKNAALLGAFYGANMMLQTLILYPFFHDYNYELCRTPTTPTGTIFVRMPHMMGCFSLLLTTAALDNLANLGLKTGA